MEYCSVGLGEVPFRFTHDSNTPPLHYSNLGILEYWVGRIPNYP